MSIYYRPLLFSAKNVKRFTAPDFSLENREKICLHFVDCVAILFHNDSGDSQVAGETMCKVAISTVGPAFGTCNLAVESGVMKAFTDLDSQPNHPFHWCAINKSTSLPFIIVYRDGWPCAFYNGDWTFKSLSDYSTTLACKSSYKEYEHQSIVPSKAILPPPPVATFPVPIKANK